LHRSVTKTQAPLPSRQRPSGSREQLVARLQRGPEAGGPGAAIANSANWLEENSANLQTGPAAQAGNHAAQKGRQSRTNKRMVGKRYRGTIVDHPKRSAPKFNAERPTARETEISPGANIKPSSIGAGAVAGFLLAMAVIGLATALAWRAHTDIASIVRTQHADMDEFETVIQRLDLAQQQITQRVDALQQVQQKNEESRLVDAQRLSEQLKFLHGELERAATPVTKQESQKRHSASGAPPQSQGSNTALRATP
jgi:hypothetical protein